MLKWRLPTKCGSQALNHRKGIDIGLHDKNKQA